MLIDTKFYDIYIKMFDIHIHGLSACTSDFQASGTGWVRRKNLNFEHILIYISIKAGSLPNLNKKFLYHGGEATRILVNHKIQGRIKNIRHQIQRDKPAPDNVILRRESGGPDSLVSKRRWQWIHMP